jgi:hypothetical protein
LLVRESDRIAGTIGGACWYSADHHDSGAAFAPLWEAEFLERVAHSKVEDWSYGIAIRRLALLRGHASMAAKGADSKTTPNVNAFTYAARLPDHNSGVPAK